MDPVSSQVSAGRTGWVHRTTWIFLILSSVALLGSSVYRATLPFGHDESISFAMFTYQPYWYGTANHHLLNTVLMRWCSKLFGNSELALRLPNVAAHGLYLLSALALVRRFHGPALQVAGFVLLNLSLLLLEYFVVARGYGLAVALQMSSIYLFVRGCEDARRGHLARDLYLSVVAGSLAVLANFSFLNYYLPLLLACGWILLTDASLRRVSRTRIGSTLVLAAGSGLFLYYVLGKLFNLQRGGHLYFGGHDGFIADTLHSLVRCSLGSAMSSPAVVNGISLILIGVCVLLLALGLRQLGSRTEAVTFGMLGLLLAAAVALAIMAHQFFDALFPIERTGLYYVPLYGVVLTYGLDALRRAGWGRRFAAPLLATAIAVAVGWSFVAGFAKRSSCGWLVDSHNRQVLALIERDRAARSPTEAVKLRASWMMEPSMNFYRLTRNYTWLVPVIRKPIPDPDYIYTFESDLDSSFTDRGTILASYPDIGTVLLRMKPVERR